MWKQNEFWKAVPKNAAKGLGKLLETPATLIKSLLGLIPSKDKIITAVLSATMRLREIYTNICKAKLAKQFNRKHSWAVLTILNAVVLIEPKLLTNAVTSALSYVQNC